MSTTQTKKTDTTTKNNEKPAPTFGEIMDKAAKSAVRGGTAGAVAMGANVACLMWMRTTVSKKSQVEFESNGMELNGIESN